MKTRAAVCRDFEAPLVIEEIDLADPGDGEVRVKLAACAICHSDILYMKGAWGGVLPAVYGHEAAGVLLLAQLEAEAGLGQRVHDRQHLAAGNAEGMAAAGLVEAPGQDLSGSGHPAYSAARSMLR